MDHRWFLMKCERGGGGNRGLGHGHGGLSRELEADGVERTRGDEWSSVADVYDIQLQPQRSSCV